MVSVLLQRLNNLPHGCCVVAGGVGVAGETQMDQFPSNLLPLQLPPQFLYNILVRFHEGVKRLPLPVQDIGCKAAASAWFPILNSGSSSFPHSSISCLYLSFFTYFTIWPSASGVAVIFSSCSCLLCLLLFYPPLWAASTVPQVPLVHGFPPLGAVCGPEVLVQHHVAHPVRLLASF